MKECRNRKKSTEASMDKSSNDGDYNALFILANSISNDAWCDHSSASYHMIPHKKWFSNYKGYYGR